MKVKDLMLDDKGIFYYMNEVQNLPFLNFTKIQTLDLGFVGLHGNRNISPMVKNIMNGEITDDKMDSLARIVISLNSEKWVNFYNVLVEELPFETHNLITTETVTDSGNTDSETLTESLNSDIDKVSAYNVDDFVEDSASERNLSDVSSNTLSDSRTRERTIQVKGHTQSLINERLKMLEYLNTNLIYDIVYLDIATMLGSLIY